MNIIKEIKNYKEITEFLDNSEKSKRLKRLIKKQIFQKFKRELKRRILK